MGYLLTSRAELQRLRCHYCASGVRRAAGGKKRTTGCQVALQSYSLAAQHPSRGLFMEPTREEVVVGQWLARLLHQNGRLYEYEAVRAVRAQFGSAFLYRPRGGNWAISKGALKVFKQLTTPGDGDYLSFLVILIAFLPAY